jgi:hypothetical protein
VSIGRARVLAGLLTVAVATVVVAGMFVLGSPAQERMRRRDDRRTQDLNNIAARILNHWGQHKRVPASLADIPTQPGYGEATSDPFTSEPYEYRATGETSYELCATFETDTSLPEYALRWTEWRHGVGRTCFQRTLPTSAKE